MEEKELNEIVIVEQLPIIKEKLQVISDAVDKEIEYALSLECNEENKNEVKKARTNINKIKTDLENKRKMVKEQILDPYYQFEDIYNSLIKEKLFDADSILKNRIDEIEYTQKLSKENELKDFVEEHCKANNIHIDFDKIGLNITLSASMKSLKEQAKTFIEKVASELKLIEQEEYNSEILYEYNKTFDYVDAKTKVLERHKQIESLEKQQEEKLEVEEQEKKIEENVDEIIAPVEIDEEKEIYQFTVKATKTEIKQLIDYMKTIGVEYE